MLVRPYDERDEDDVISLWREVFPDAPPWNDPKLDIRRKLSVQRDLFLVAEVDGRVTGSAMGGYDGHRGWVYYLAVSGAARGQGIGTALMVELEERLTVLGCNKLNLQVRTSNSGVVDFYDGLGYAVEDLVSMGKLLGDAERGPMHPIRFISEPVDVETEGGHALPEKRPGAPSAFTWRGQVHRVARHLSEWHDYERKGRMARNMRPEHSARAEQTGSWGVGRHYHRVVTESGRVFDLYYDRAPRNATDRKGGWYLFRELAE